MDFTERFVSRETLYRGRVFTVHRDAVTLPGGKPGSRELVEHNGGVGILPLHGDGTVTLVRQFRYGAGCELWEIPAGKLERGEEPLSCGVRELREECRLHAGRVTPLGRFHPTPAYDTEVIWLYLAEDLSEADGQLDEDEFLEPLRIPLAEAAAMAADGRLEDGKTIIALLRVWQRRYEYGQMCSAD